jgi:hypothetical protein
MRDNQTQSLGEESESWAAMGDQLNTGKQTYTGWQQGQATDHNANLIAGGASSPGASPSPAGQQGPAAAPAPARINASWTQAKKPYDDAQVTKRFGPGATLVKTVKNGVTTWRVKYN